MSQIVDAWLFLMSWMGAFLIGWVIFMIAVVGAAFLAEKD